MSVTVGDNDMTSIHGKTGSRKYDTGILLICTLEKKANCKLK